MLSIGRALVGAAAGAAARRALAGTRAGARRADHGPGPPLADTLGLAVLLVEQNARSALSIANRGIVLNLGRVVAEQDPDKLTADDRLRHAYLGF